MSAVQIANRLQYLAQFAGNGGLTCSGITCQHDMNAGLLLLTETTLGTLNTIMNRKGNLTDSLLHLIHTDITVKVAEDILQRTLLGHIAPDILLLHLYGIGSTADERGKDILCSLDGHMSITESIVFNLHLILEETVQLVVGFMRIGRDAILTAQLHLTNIAEFLITRSRQTECVLEAVLGSRVGSQEVIKTFRKTGYHDNRILVPFVHLDKQLIERVHLIGITVRQQFLYVVEEQDATLCLFHVVVPLVNKTLVVYSVDHRQLGLLNNLVLVEIVTNHLCKSRLTGSRLTYNNSIDAQAHIHDVLARM